MPLTQVPQMTQLWARPAVSNPVLSQSVRMLWAGSSSEASRWTGTGTVGMDGARPTGYTMIAANRLALRGLPLNNQSYFGDQANDIGGVNSPAQMALYDTRFHDFSGIIVNNGNSSMGGFPIRFPSATGCEFYLDITQSVDSIALYIQFASISATNNRFIYSVDGGSETTVPVTTYNDVLPHRLLISGLTPGTHTLRVRTPTSTPNDQNINLVGVEAFTSTRKEVIFMPAGARGWSTSSTFWTRSGGISPLGLLPVVSPDIVLATFGGNEGFTNSASYAAYYTRCVTWGNAVLAAGGTPVFVGKPYMTEEYYSVTDRLNALFNGVPTYRMGVISEALAIAEGEQAADGLHWLGPWHAREGAAVGDWLYETLFPSLKLYS